MAIVRSEQEAERIIEELLQKEKENTSLKVFYLKGQSSTIRIIKNVLMRTTSFGEYTRKALIEYLETENK